MVLNYIWIAFFVIAFIIALIKVIFLGDTEIFTAIMNSTFDSSKTAFEISLGLTGVLALWLGIMKIGENSGLINALARFLSPVLCRLFPDIPKGHPVLGSIFMNMSANMLGLDNAATPLGLKAMKELQELNPKKDTASNPMIMFLVINTSGLIIIPISIMVYRAQTGAMDFLVGGIGYVVDLCGVDTSFVGALPTALMKSLSGSGANGLMIDTMKEMGPDSFVGRMSCVVRGASDTTFYILAVYFGSVGISKTRNAVTCGLIADFSGIIAAILISYLFFF